MKKKIVISGFGGQGVMSVGKNLVEAGMAEGYYVTWAPSYGPEMRHRQLPRGHLHLPHRRAHVHPPHGADRHERPLH